MAYTEKENKETNAVGKPRRTETGYEAVIRIDQGMKKKRHIAEQFPLLCEKCSKPIKSAKDTIERYCMDCCGKVLDKYFEQRVSAEDLERLGTDGWN